MEKKRKILFTGIFIVTILILAFSTGYYKKFSERDSLIFAVIAPVTGPDKSVGEAIIRGSRLCADKINNKGGIDGKKIKLVFYDDKNDKRTAMSSAYEIASKNNALVVLGHYYSSVSADTGKVYKKMGIPAITAYATAESVTAENNWYFRIVPNNSLQAEFIARYSAGILNKTSASIIFDNDTYGSSLVENFEKTALKSNIKIIKKWEFSKDDKNLETSFNRIISELEATKDPGIIFLATHGLEGAKIAKSLVYPGSEYLVIGADALSGTSFRKAIADYSKEYPDPGYHLNGIYAISHFSMNIGNEKTYMFRKEFVKRYGEEPSWVSACAFDAVSVAAEAARLAETGDKKSIRNDRRKIRTVLEGFYNSENAYTGVTGRIFFDKNGDVVKYPVLGIYKENKFLPSFFQYRITDMKPEKIDENDFLEKNLSGDLIGVNGTPMRKTSIVYTGMRINEIRNLNIKKSTYTADFDICFQYKGNFDPLAIKFINTINHIKGKPIKKIETDDSSIVRIYNFTGNFRNTFDFHKYPFDSHILNIKFYHPELTSDRLIFIPDTSNIFDSIKNIDVGTINLDGVTGWKIQKTSFFQDVSSNISEPHDLVNLNSMSKNQWSRFNALINIKRSDNSAVIRSFLPIFTMIIILFVTFIIPHKRFSLRVIIIMAILIANVILHNAGLSNMTVEYTTIIEYAYWSVYLLVVCFILLLYRKL